MLIIKVSILILLLVIFMQDMKTRAVYWFAFPLLAALFIGQRWVQGQQLQAIISECVLPVGFILIQLVILTLYFSVKQKQPVLITKGLLGLGDILFLFCACFYFSVINFIGFYIGSLILTIVIWAFFLHPTASKKTVPLAGLQALILAGVFIFQWSTSAFNPSDDSKLTTLIAHVYGI